MKTVKIKDVAKEAGVSVTTVSRVLNNRGYISDEMRGKVLKAIDELNYTPNEIARSFYSNKTKFIALIVPTTENPFFGELTFHIEKILANNGYNLFICNSLNDSRHEKKYLQLLKEKRVDGIIVGSHNIDISEYQYFKNKIVSIERELTDDIPIIQSDNYQGGIMATKELIENGCKKILCIIGDRNVKTPANNRSKAYLDEMKKSNLVPHQIEIPFNLSIYQKKEIVKEILGSNELYDGIFAGDDILAKLFINAAQQVGIKVPEELKIIGFDGTSIIRLLNPELSTIQQPLEDLSKGAVETLLKLLNGEDMKKELVFPVKLVSSNSTAGK